MRKNITYKDLKDIIITPYRRIIIYSYDELPNFKKNAFNNYIEEERFEEILNEYMKTLEKTKKQILPYLFIFKDYKTNNQDFLKHSNWLILE